MERNQFLDLLRAIAILLVVLLHAEHVKTEYPSILSSFFQIGWIGVDLFFVLSGFLIGRQAFTEEVVNPYGSLKNFWIKRWTRTLPLYFVVLFFYAAIKPLLGYPFVGQNWGFLVFWQNYTGLNDFVQSWSLCIEEQFYFFFPLLIFILGLQKKLPAWGWLLIMFASMGFRAWPVLNGQLDNPDNVLIDYTVRFKTHMHLDGIAVGIFLAKTYPQWPQLNRKLRNIIALCGWAIAFTLPFLSKYNMSGWYSIFTFSLLAIAFGAILYGNYDLKVSPILYPYIEKVALWSYGIYLWNHIIIRAMEKVKVDLGWPIMFSIFIFASFVIAIITYYIVEVPGLKLRKYLIKQVKL